MIKIQKKEFNLLTLVKKNVIIDAGTKQYIGKITWVSDNVVKLDSGWIISIHHLVAVKSTDELKK